MAEETTKKQTRGRGRSALKFLLLCLVCGAILAAGALFILRPYERLEKMIKTAISNNAPPPARRSARLASVSR